MAEHQRTTLVLETLNIQVLCPEVSALLHLNARGRRHWVIPDNLNGSRVPSPIFTDPNPFCSFWVRYTAGLSLRFNSVR